MRINWYFFEYNPFKKSIFHHQPLMCGLKKNLKSLVKQVLKTDFCPFEGQDIRISP